MANIKKRADINQGVSLNTLINGLLIGGGGFGISYLLKKLQRQSDMRKRISELEEFTNKEIAKDDIGISGDFFRDKYIPYEKKAAGGLNNLPGVGSLPGLALLLSAAGISYAGLGALAEQSAKTYEDKTPKFALDYKKRRQKEFERAARLLRAVTDAPTWKDVAAQEKTAGMQKKAGNLIDLLVGKERADKMAGGFGSGGEKLLNDLRATLTDYIQPAIATAAIGGAGYLGWKGLNKLIYQIRNERNRKLIEGPDAAVNAWLANRKDLGEPGKVLNAYIENDDSAEKEELNKLLAAYESRYKK